MGKSTPYCVVLLNYTYFYVAPAFPWNLVLASPFQSPFAFGRLSKSYKRKSKFSKTIGNHSFRSWMRFAPKAFESKCQLALGCASLSLRGEIWVWKPELSISSIWMVIELWKLMFIFLPPQPISEGCSCSQGLLIDSKSSFLNEQLSFIFQTIKLKILSASYA